MKNIIVAIIVGFLTACASGSAIVSGAPRPALDPSQVVLYLEPPTSAYTLVGLVRASSDMGLTNQQSQDYAVAELKKQAAKIGANGVLLQGAGTQTLQGGGTGFMTGDTLSMFTYNYDKQSVEGKAIYVTPQ